MGHSEDDAVYKTPHKNENILAESTEIFGIGFYWNLLYRIGYKKIDVIHVLVQCPFKTKFQYLNFSIKVEKALS